MYRTLRALLVLAFIVPALTVTAQSKGPARAIVADFYNASQDRHTTLIRIVTDAVALELHKAGAYEVVARQEVDRAMKARRLEPPYHETDLAAIGKELDSQIVVTGEIHHVQIRTKGGQKEVEVGLIVRVRDTALGELVNGAAERGTVVDTGGKPEVLMVMDAASNAAYRAAARLAAYRPVMGTILNTAGRGPVVINRGSGHGIQRKQEFVVFRDGFRVGRIRVQTIHPSYAEMEVLDGTGGIRPEDKALSIFPDPRFTGK